jgi:outer membrane lipoprotein carrier protein
MLLKKLLVVAALAVSVPSVSAGQDAKALFRELQQTYDSARDLSARFVQRSHLAAAGMDRDVTGKVVFKKGGKMRWTYEGDDPQEIVSDGKTLWIHQVRDRTVMRQDLEKVATANRFALDLLSGLRGLSEAFHVESCGETCLALTPKDARPDLTRILLEMEPKKRELRVVTTEDPLGNRTRIELKDLRWNTGVKDELFRFKVPRGAEVLEMPGSQG